MVDETETTFGAEHMRMDEYVFSARRVLTEGEKPKLELVIENPRVGLLSALREQWCWFAWDSNWGGAPNVIPLFFGRIVGIPMDVQAEMIQVTFIAWPSNYKKQLQELATTMKVLPFYDPVFTDVSRRDDPMSIFEAHSKLVCVDPVTHVVSASDILTAEDGNVDFTEDDHFYDSLVVSPGAVPKTVVHVDATVSWTQTARGYLQNFANVTLTHYMADSLKSDWPKHGSQIADGLTVFTSSALETTGVDDWESHTVTHSWTNKEKHHEDGDALSSNLSITSPSDSAPIDYFYQPGFLDPYATDGNGDPSPTNIPMSFNSSHISYYEKSVTAAMSLEYQAARVHTERLIFNLFASVQPTTLDPDVSEDSETLVISGSDVGQPIIEMLNWTGISGEAVAFGTIIFPDDQELPSGRTAQIAIVGGTAGLESPEFSDVFGEETVDGTVTWSSLGTPTPSESAPDWTPISNVQAGTLILPRRPIFLAGMPDDDAELAEGQYVRGDNSTYLVGIGGGVMVALASIPSGVNYYIAKTDGVSGATVPNFDTTLHAVTTDGTVEWVSVGEAEIPVGGTPGNVTSSTYFGRDRGKQSIGHLICRARARLRFASRVVASSFRCSFLRGTALTLRKSVSLHDGRLPGGFVLGKVTGTVLEASNDGSFSCAVSVASSVGYDEVVSEVPGDPTYVEAGYVADGYQLMDNIVVVLPEISDVGYSPIVPIPDEDGITFPLQKHMLLVSETIKTGPGFVPPTPAELRDKARDFTINDVGLKVRKHKKNVPVDNKFWYELVLKPLNGRGTFQHVYHVRCTKLSLPQMINLEEESTT